MRECVVPGSFDPITCGHISLVERTAKIYDSVTVAVMVNISKNGLIPYEERIRIIQKACSGIPNVKVILWKGLLADYIRNNPGSVVIRSVRNTVEFEHEFNSAEINRRLYPGMETLLMPAAAEWADVSSSAVREIAAFDGDIRGLVPANVYRDILKWVKK